MTSRSGNKGPWRKATSIQTNTDNHIPRFEFGINIDHEGNRTATIKDLLVELNREINIHQDENSKGNELVDLEKRSLDTVLNFLSKISGKSLRSRAEEHPEKDIKTIKSLFIHSRKIKQNLISWLEPPDSHSESIIDILNGDPTEKNNILFRGIYNISNEISKEIPDEELISIEEIKKPIGDMDAYLLDATKAIDDIILRHFYWHEDLTIVSDEFLAKKTMTYLELLTLTNSRIGIHSRTYTYLRNIKYIHWLYFILDIKLTIPDDRTIKDRTVSFDDICNKIVGYTHVPIKKDTNFMHPNDVPSFIERFSANIANLVSASTGLSYREDDVLNDKRRAINVLKLYLDITNLPNKYNATPIGIVHVVAAFSSIRHQRKSKVRLGHHSKEYSAKIKSPQKILDAYESNTIHKMPYTVRYIYRERMLWYLCALTGRKEKFDSYSNLLIAQIKLYKEIYMSLDSEYINNKITDYRQYIADAADEFVILHNRKNFILEWESGEIGWGQSQKIKSIIFK